MPLFPTNPNFCFPPTVFSFVSLSLSLSHAHTAVHLPELGMTSQEPNKASFGKTMSSTLMPNLLHRLRPLVGFQGWDYCVLWHLSQDQRSIEWIDCCCGGAENMNQNDGEKLHFAVSPLFLCRDTISQHPTSNPCHLLALLPSSMPLVSGCCYSLTLLSNQPKWLNLSSSSDSTALEETAGTKVLIPAAFGIIELFVTKQISEDQRVIDFIISQCTISTEQESMANSTFMDISFSFDRKHLTDNQTKYFHPRISQTTTLENFNLNFLQRSDVASDSRTKNGTFDESSQEMETFQKILMNDNTSNDHIQFMENSVYNELQWNDNKELVKQKSGSSESLSDCSDQINDNDDVKCHRRTGQVLKSKNLMAERRRRKKLNDRLFALRALVPKISKMHKAAILEDAIEFVKELQQQVEELQEELEGGKNNITNNGSHSIDQTEFISQNAVSQWPNSAQDRAGNEISQQMEPQLKVAELNDHEFFVKVFCENKRGGFTRLMEALNSLGMEVSSANMTSHRGLVSNVLRVVKKDNETVQPDRLRDSLLELTRHPSSRGD